MYVGVDWGGTKIEVIGLTEDGDELGRVREKTSLVVNTLDPDVLVLGGGMWNITELYDDLPPLLASYAFSPCCYTPVVRARHGDSSGVRGAAYLWKQ